MSDINDRRARKKAQTRELIRTTAHRMFAEQGFDVVTIAEIARECDVAVQTVFNHFPTKEDLFFDARPPFVDGPAQAVRDRDPSESPLDALSAFMATLTAARVGAGGSAEWRCYTTTLQASPALRARERELIFESERRLSAALLDAWAGDDRCAGVVPPDPSVAAPLLAALWMAASRVLIAENRPLVAEGADAAEVAGATETLAVGLFSQLEAAFAVLATADSGSTTDTGWPRTEILRAG